MKTLTNQQLSEISGAGYYTTPAEDLVEGAILGGFTGLLIASATQSRSALNTILDWAVLGGVLNVIVNI